MARKGSIARAAALLRLTEPTVSAQVHALEAALGEQLVRREGRNCRILQGPDTDPGARAQLSKAVREQDRSQVTLLNYKKNGTPFWNKVTVFPVRTPDGEPLHWIGGVQHDVTSLVEARAEVDRLYSLDIRRQEFDQAILNGVDVGIVTSDAGGRVTFANRCAREVLRREVGPELNGEDVRALLCLPSAPGSILRASSERRLSIRLVDMDVALDLRVSRAPEQGHDDLGFFSSSTIAPRKSSSR